jgi:hypothetical protein
VDPSTALANLICALDAGNVPAAREALDALTGWHDRGGFLPRWPDVANDLDTLEAFHLGRLVAALDFASEPGRTGPVARRAYRSALAALSVVMDTGAL